MRRRRLLRYALILIMVILSVSPPFGQAQVWHADPYRPSGILGTELGGQVPPGRLNVRLESQLDADLGQAPRFGVVPHTIDAVQAVPAVTPEIAALAAGLENNPLALYDYVYNHIDYVPSWGLLKNARETLLAGVGNAFDQSALLSALLRSAGFQTRYAWGTIQITRAQATTWVGAADPAVVGNVFASGGIPTVGVGNMLQLSHIWVEVFDGGVWRTLDPSFKLYAEQAGQDLPTRMGYNLATFLSRAQEGMPIAGDYTQNLNHANIRADLASFASNLLGWLRAGDPFADVHDLIGGRRIVPIASSAYPPLPAYTAPANPTRAAEIPDSFAYTLRIQLPGIDQTVNVDDIAGERITIFYVCATVADCDRLNQGGGVFNVEPAYQVNVVPQLRIGGELVATGSPLALGTWQQLNVTFDTPISGQPAFSLAQTLTAGEWYALPLRLQMVSSRALARHLDLLNDAIAQGLPMDDERVLGELLSVLGMAYYNEVDLGDQIDSRLAQVVVVPHFSVMIASRNLIVFIDNLNRPVDLDPASHTVDVRLHFDSVISAQNPANTTRERAWMFGAGMRGSATEHAIMEQIQSVDAVSTIQALRVAQETGQRIYYITSSNLNGVIPALGHHPNIINAIIDAVSSGRDVVISQNPITYGQWEGSGWISLDPESGAAGYLIAGSINPFAQAAPLIVNGGSGTRVQGADESTSKEALGRLRGPHIEPTQVPSKMETTSDPIDTETGNFRYRQVDMAPFGGLGIPLGFERFYSSSQHGIGGPLGFGWSHTYATRFLTTSDWPRAFGRRTAAEAVPALVAARIGVDLFDAANIPGRRFPIDTFVSAWLMGRLTGNAATLIEPDGTFASHVRLVDGSYQPPHGEAGLASLVEDGEGATLTWESGTSLHFDPDGRMAALEDPAGNRTTLAYDGQQRLAQVTDAVGRTLSFSYDGQGRLVQVANHIGTAVRYSYDSQGNLQNATGLRGDVTAYAYDAGHRITGITDPAGSAFVANQYNPAGQVVSQVNGRGGETRLYYGGDRTVVIDPRGYRTTFFFDRGARLAGILDPLGIRTAFEYDAADHETRRVNGLGQATTFGYDARGRLISRTDPLNQTTSWAYDTVGNLTALTDQGGKTWHLAYDDHHNLTSITDPLGAATHFTYNGQGLVTQVADATGRLTTSTYDAHGNLACLTDAANQSSCWAYDGVGHATRFTDAIGQVTQYEYDVAGNLVRITDPLNHSVHYTYDPNGNLSQFTNANGHTSAFAYDAQFNLVKVTDAAGGVTNYTYDANDGLVTIADAAGRQTSYQRDAVGRVTGVTDPLGRTVGFGYDAADRVTSYLPPGGAGIAYQYDARGRITGIDYPAGPDSTYSYNAAGYLSSATHGGWSAGYTYDDAGRLIAIADASRNLNVAYAYDPAGRRTGMQVTRGTAMLYNLAYSYDTLGRLAAIEDGASIPPARTTFGYDAAGRETTIGAPNGARADYAYAGDGRLARVAHYDRRGVDVAAFDYSYDAGGNVTAITESTPVGAQTTGYSYDALDRLTREAFPHYAIDYSYDATGNLIQRSDARGTVSYTYDAAGQLQSRGGEQFSYDQRGNLVSWSNPRGTYTYSYNDDNLLTGLSLPDSTSLSFSYDAFGRRVAVQGPAGGRGFLHDGLRVILEGDSALNEPAAHYVHAEGLLATRYTPDVGTVSYHGDAQGNVRYLIGNNGRPLDSYDYDGFGRAGAPAGIDPNPFRFAGQHGVYQDLLSGWHMGYRDYDPDSGRFLTRDPLPGNLMFPSGLNDYAYGFGNPLRYSDPSGLRPDAEVTMSGQPQPGTDPATDARRRARRGQVPATSSGISSSATPSPGPSNKKPALPNAPGVPSPNMPQPGSYEQQPGPPTIAYMIGYDVMLLDAEKLLRALRWIREWLMELQRRQQIDIPPDIPPSQPEGPSQPTPFDLPEDEPLRWTPISDSGGAYALNCVNGNQLLAGAFQDGLLRSADPGHAGWPSVANAGIRVIAAGSDVYYAGTRFGGILKSSDSGQHWAPANNGMIAHNVYALAIDSGGRVFAGTEMGLFVSTDGGASWSRADSLPGRVVTDLAVAGDIVLAATDMGLYRSADQGASWQPPTTNLPVTRINMLVVTGGIVYAGTAQGLYRSTDGGAGWLAVAGLKGHDVHALAVDPQNSNTIFVGTVAGLWASNDGGTTWAPDSHGGLSGGGILVGALAFCQTATRQEQYLGTGGGIYALRLVSNLPIIKR